MRPVVPLLLMLACTAAIADPLSVDRVMADPDWIGNPVESAWWSLDGNTVLYQQKQVGATLRDTVMLDLAANVSHVVAPAQAATLDGADPVFDRQRARAVFVRAGDVYVRDLHDGSLKQLTATPETEASPQFAADQSAVMWRINNDWYRYAFAEGVARAIALPRAEKDPQADPPADDLRANQLRLISTLAHDRDQRKALQDQAEQLRKADPGRAAAPVYLGDQVKIEGSSLSPDGRWLLVVTTAKGGESGQVEKLPHYVTESGYNDIEDARTRVGRNPPLGHTLQLIDLADRSVHAVTLDRLPGIADDPLAALRKAAGKDALKGNRLVTIPDLRWADDASRAAVMLRAIDNKDRWIATLDPTKPVLESVHRLTDPGWINWTFNEFGWLPASHSLWWLSEQSGTSHLYLRAEGKPARALTSGHWEVSQPLPNADGSRFYFVCNRAAPGRYELCALDVASGALRELTAQGGVEDFVLAPDQSRILLHWSASYLPPQLALVATDGSGAHSLTDTRSEAFKAQDWIAPQFVQVPSRHGAGSIAAKLYRPQTLEPGKHYPVVMFVHGAGYLQNVCAALPELLPRADVPQPAGAARLHRARHGLSRLGRATDVTGAPRSTGRWDIRNWRTTSTVSTGWSTTSRRIAPRSASTAAATAAS